MLAKQKDIPYLGYAAVIALLLVWLLWQNSGVRAREQAVEREAAAARAQQQSVADLFSQGGPVDQPSGAVREIRGQARQRFKLGFLLLVAFPTAVLFPAWLTTYTPPKERSKVVSARSMTRDDIDLGIPERRLLLHPATRLFAVDMAVYGIVAAILTLFPLLKPRVYGGSRTWLLFAVAALMAFCGCGMACRLQLKRKTPERIALQLGAGFVALGGLAWFFL